MRKPHEELNQVVPCIDGKLLGQVIVINQPLGHILDQLDVVRS